MQILIKNSKLKNSSDIGNNSVPFFEQIYPFNTETVQFSKKTINGRYPEQGFAANSELSSIYYVESGAGYICYKDNYHELSKGDAFLFQKNDRYWLEGEDLVLIVTKINGKRMY
ncbi:hypothetical protein HOK51_00480 [Candidatus Woesearchaeota archaeon]|nr:hypothetical protein [Candidatus Woesearchaeota archaeon]MBT6518289.1 hypothetical protein [Candidatus Woesearchaeota archaeon]MBT7367072.1 hypothetical protein [Candidatus Woesearchaeota archaeon]